MTAFFTLTMHPAREGDCLEIEYGVAGDVHRVLIDGGRSATYRHLKKMYANSGAARRRYELLVVTHVDRDHIEGALAMLEDDQCPLEFDEVWFNCYKHLVDPKFEAMGAVQGERLSLQLRKRYASWNAAFKRCSVELRPRQRPTCLPGGLTITLLSPSRSKLEALVPKWDQECIDAKISAGRVRRPDREFERYGAVNVQALADSRFVDDHKEANGSSIAVLAEFANRRVMLCADAHAGLLAESLRPLAATAGGRLELAALKLSHHGSDHNVSKDLLGLVACSRYLVSTNGSYFEHPKQAAIARVVVHGGNHPQLVFNYRSQQSAVWDNPPWKRRYGYSTEYPSATENGTYTVDLMT